MKKKTIMVLMTLFLMVASTFATAAIQTVDNEPLAQLYVNPDYIVKSVGETFIISVEVADISEFYGFDIKFRWDTTILSYVDHTVTVPVETYPGGVLHASVLPITDTVDDAAGTYNLVISSLAPAPSFNGSGTIFEMTFEVLAEGSSALEIYDTDLANIRAEPIEHEITNGLFETPGAPPEVHDVAVVSCTSSPTSVDPGDSVSISVAIENLGDFNEDFDVEVFYDGIVISSTTGSLMAGGSDVYPFTWDTTGVTPGTYVITAEATLLDGTDDNPGNNFCTDGEVTIREAQPPPVDTVSVTICPEFSSGEYPEWKYFTVTNLGMEGIVKITVVLPETDPMLEPEAMELEFIPNGICPDDSCGWTINFHENDREIIAHSNDPDHYYLPRSCSAVLKIKFGNGPSNCLEPIIFNVYISDNCGTLEKRTLYEYIDKEDPIVEITFPGSESLTIDPDNDYVFVKKIDGTIWVQKPDGTQTKTNWVLIEGTVQDPSTERCPYASGIDRVEIWMLFGTLTYNDPSDAISYPNGVWVYMGDATLDVPYMHEPCSEPIDELGLADNKNLREWTWKIDPTKECHYKAHGTDVWVHWIKEEWYAVKAIAFDNAVNDDKYWEIHQEYTCRPAFNRYELMTNHAETAPHWFFWMTLQTCQFSIQPWTPGNGIVCMRGSTGYNPGSTVTISLWDNFYGYEFTSWTTVEADMYGRFYIEKRLPELPRHPHEDCSTDMYYWMKAVDEYGNGEDDPKSFTLIPWITYEDTLSESNLDWWDTTETGNVYDTITVYGHGFLPSRKAGYDPYSTVSVHIIYTDVAPLESWDYRTVWTGSGHWNCRGMDEWSWYPRLSETILTNVQTDEHGYWTAEIQIPQSYGGFHAIYADEYNVVTDPYMPGPGVPQGDTKYDLVKSGWPEITDLWEEQAVLFDVWPTIEISPSEALTDQYVTITGEGLPLPKYYKLWKNDDPIYASRDWCLVLDFGPYEQWVFENKRIRNNEFDQSWAMELWYPFSFYSPDPACFVDDPESLVWHGKLCSILYDWGYEADPQIHFGSKFLKTPIMQPGDYSVTLYYYDKSTGDFTFDHSASTAVSVSMDSLHTSLVSLEENVATVMTKIGEIQVHISDLNAKVVTIEGTIVTISTDIGSIKTDVTNIDAEVVAIKGNVVTIQTTIGVVKASADSLNAAIVSLQEDVVTIHTDVGNLQVKLSEINGIVEIENNIATITTDLGIVKGEVTSLTGTVADIETDIGTIREEADLIKGSVALQPASITLSLIAALAAVAAAALILRKVYLK